MFEEHSMIDIRILIQILNKEKGKNHLNFMERVTLTHYEGCPKIA